MGSERRTVLSLFDHSGVWSQPYRDAGYRVIQIDLKHGIDVLSLDEAWVRYTGRVDIILAAPDCTHFAGSGAQYWKAKDADGRTASAIVLVRKVLWLVEQFGPEVWALENPVGRLNTLMPELRPYGPWYWQPHWYGDAYTKKTGLWGNFNHDLPQTRVPPIRANKQGSWVQSLGGKSERTKELRSVTPAGFAQAFFLANP